MYIELIINFLCSESLAWNIFDSPYSVSHTSFWPLYRQFPNTASVKPPPPFFRPCVFLPSLLYVQSPLTTSKKVSFPRTLPRPPVLQFLPKIPHSWQLLSLQTFTIFPLMQVLPFQISCSVCLQVCVIFKHYTSIISSVLYVYKSIAKLGLMY